MSQFASQCSSLREMLQKHPEAVVIEIFCRVLGNEDWDSEDMIQFLRSGKGISQVGDHLLDEYIRKELEQL